MSSLEISYGVMSLPRFSFAILAWWSRTRVPTDSPQPALCLCLVFMEYVTTWYRAPELWDAKGQAASLQALLTPAIDMWSYGCVVFEAFCGQALMKALDHRRSLKNTLAEWCKGYPELVARKMLRSQYSSSIIAHWAVNLQTCSSLKAVVLCACAPNAKSRTWT